jgi:hypothetical protein
MSRKIERVEIHDLSDALLQQGRGLSSSKARRRALHLELVRWATANEAGRNIHTPLRCPLRPKAKACPGRLIVRRQDLPTQVEYVCEVCGGGATLISWSGGEADLRSAARAPQRKPLSIQIDVGQHELLARMLLEDEVLQPRLYQARPRSCGWELRLDFEETSRLFLCVLDELSIQEPSDLVIRERILDRLAKTLAERIPGLRKKPRPEGPSLLWAVSHWVYEQLDKERRTSTGHAYPPDEATLRRVQRGEIRPEDIGLTERVTELLISQLGEFFDYDDEAEAMNQDRYEDEDEGEDFEDFEDFDFYDEVFGDDLDDEQDREPFQRYHGAQKRLGPAPQTYVLEIDLLDLEPRIWRRVELPSNCSLELLHVVIQILFEWQDMHLHEFRVGKRRFSRHPDTDALRIDDGSLSEDSSNIDLGALGLPPGSVFEYEYDFGERWIHQIQIREIRDQACDTYRCRAGAQFAPGEDNTDRPRDPDAPIRFYPGSVNPNLHKLEVGG